MLRARRHVEMESGSPSLVQAGRNEPKTGFDLHRSHAITMKTRIAAFAAAAILGVVSISSAMAYETPSRYTGYSPYAVETTGSFGGYGPRFDRDPANCRLSSAAEGNANQQNFPVKQYGQTSGGNRC